MYHEKCPKGKVFDRSDVKDLEKDGWVDTPAKLKNKPIQTIPKINIEKADPKLLVSMVKGMGYKVLTDVELQAEIGKAGTFDISSVSDDELIAEAEKRGLKENDPESAVLDKLEERFIEKPTELIKEELIQLGNIRFKLGLRSNMKEETLIEKITAAING